MLRPHAVAAPVLVGPLDGTDAKGNPILDSTAVDIVLRRKGSLQTSEVAESRPAAKEPGPKAEGGPR